MKEPVFFFEKCDFILCTGFFDEQEDDLEFYKTLLKNYANKKLVCTNPDLVVHRGNVEELCAGSIAKVFESLGGEVIYYGKPYKAVYKNCFKYVKLWSKMYTKVI